MNTPCREWTGSRASSGLPYGRTNVNGKEKRVHRLEWEKHNGPIPAGLFVLHHCDNPPCYEITHLFLGTQDDNMKDKVSKGRQARLETHGRSMLTADDVRAIRGSTATQKQLAAQYGVAYQTIGRIKRNETWVGVS